MARELRLNELDDALTDLSYPVERETAAAELGGTTLLLADGEVALDDVVASSNDDRFDSAADLESAVRSNLPREAVGEPYQSEGEG